MNINQNILIMVLAVIVLWMMTSRKSEKMTNEKTKQCSQKSINDAYQNWIFGSTKFVR